jgi:hypothetical protein
MLMTILIPRWLRWEPNIGNIYDGLSKYILYSFMIEIKSNDFICIEINLVFWKNTYNS